MVLSIGAQVFMRKFINSSISWSEELARYCFIWLVFIGISYATKHSKHIIVNILPIKRLEKVFSFISLGTFFIFTIIVIIYGWKITNMLVTSGQITPALRIPMSYVYLAAPIGMALTTIRLMQNLYEKIRFPNRVKSES